MPSFVCSRGVKPVGSGNHGIRHRNAAAAHDTFHASVVVFLHPYVADCQAEIWLDRAVQESETVFSVILDHRQGNAQRLRLGTAELKLRNAVLTLRCVVRAEAHSHNLCNVLIAGKRVENDLVVLPRFH